jgi:hypothetical protein
MIKKSLLFCLFYATTYLYSNPTADSLQMIITLADNWTSTTGYMQRYERPTQNDAWITIGEKIPVSFGLNGLGWGIGLHDEDLNNVTLFKEGPRVIEGSKRSPVGVFALNIAFGKANTQEKNIKLSYIPITAHTWGVDDIKSKYYNRITDDQLVTKDWDSAEDMNRYANEGVYEFGIIIEHNYDKPIPGKGSCFFIHIHRNPGLPTLGCTAFERELVKEVVYWLDKAKKPILVQLPSSIFNALKKDWNLPDFVMLESKIKIIDQELEKRIVGNSWEAACPVPLSELRYLTINYWGYDDKAHIGEMIVHEQVAQEVLDIFQELFENKFPIQSMRLIDDYFKPNQTKNDVDELSMLDNNSSAFFFRYIGKTTIVSEHGMGTAIDINPLVNPFVRGDYVCPVSSKEFCDRTRKDVKGLLTDDCICVKAFEKRGWIWAGKWKKVQDYQHFCKVQKESLQ